MEDCLANNIQIINSCVDLGRVEGFLNFSKTYEGVYCTIGCSPSKISEDMFEKTIEIIRKQKKEIIGIGEVGLDYYWVKEQEKHQQQREFFRKFVELSQELKLPLIIHSRESEEDLIEILKENKQPALLHCYSGTKEQAEEAIDLGCLISIPTSIVYSHPKQELVKQLPLESIVLESDAPYLAPTPKTRNMPQNIRLSLEKISGIKGMEEEEVEERTSENTKKFFKL
ncbi:TatD family hydrolase [Candidatus Altiarchaeota archaeon]